MQSASTRIKNRGQKRFFIQSEKNWKQKPITHYKSVSRYNLLNQFSQFPMSKQRDYLNPNFLTQ